VVTSSVRPKKNKPSYALDEVGFRFAAMKSLTAVLLITFSVTDLATLYCSLRLE